MRIVVRGIFSVVVLFLLAGCGGGGGSSNPASPSDPLPVSCSPTPPSTTSTQFNAEYGRFLDSLAVGEDDFVAREGILSSTYEIGSFLQNGSELEAAEDFSESVTDLGEIVFNEEFTYSSEFQDERSLGLLEPFSLGIEYAKSTDYEGSITYQFSLQDVSLKKVQNTGSVINDNLGLAIGSDSFVEGVYVAKITNTIVLDAQCSFDLDTEVGVLFDIIEASTGSSANVEKEGTDKIEVTSEIPIPIAYLIRDVSVPSPRLNVTASVEQGPIVILDWDEVEGVNNFRVLFSRISGFKRGDVGVQESTAVGQSQQISENFLPGEDVYFRVFPTAGGNLIDTSESELAVTIPETTPEDTLLLEATNLSQSGIQLNWSLPANNDANVYRIERGEAPGFTRSLIASINRRDAREAFRKRQFVDTDLQPSTQYRYWIQYGNYLSAPFSDYSAPVTLTSSSRINLRPTANAGEPQTVNAGNTVFLDGSGSFDPDSPTITFVWEPHSANSQDISLTNSQSDRPSFITPAVTVETTLTIKLTVSDGVSSDTDFVDIVVSPVNTTNRPPVANVFAQQNSVLEGNAVVLDASASSDPEGASLSYRWTQIDLTGANVGIDGAETPSVSFIAPSVDEDTELQFRVDVSDGANTHSAEISVNILNEIASTSDLTIDIVTSPNPAQPGERVKVELYLTNKAAFRKNDITVNMPYPAQFLADLNEGIVSDSGNCTGGGSSVSCDVTGDRITWNFSSIESQSSKRLDLLPFVAGDTNAGSLIEFNAEVLEKGQLKDTGNKTFTVVDDRPLQLSLSSAQAIVTPGESLELELAYGNTSASSAIDNLALELHLPSGVVLQKATNGATQSGSTLLWEIERLVPGQSGKQYVTVEVQGGQSPGQLLRFDADIRSQQGGTPSVIAQSMLSVEPERAIELAVEVFPKPAERGEPVWIDLVASNTSTFDRRDLSIQMRYPSTFLANLNQGLTSDGGNCAGTGSSVSCDAVGDWLIWNIPNLSAQSATRLSLLPFIRSDAQSGSVFELVPYVVESGRIVSESRRNMTIVSDRAFEVSINADKNPVQIGESLTYEVQYSNTALSSAARQVSLVVSLPEHVQYVSGSGQPTVDGDLVTWELGTLVPGQTGKQEISVMVQSDAQLGSLLAAIATMSSNDEQTLSTEVESIISVEDDRPLDLDINVTPEPTVAGNTLNVTLTLTNNASFTRTGLNIHLRYPAQFLNNFNQSLASDGGNCNGSGSSVSCDAVGDWLSWRIESLDAGASKTVSFSPVVSSNTPAGSLINFQAEVEENDVWMVDARQSVRIQEQ